jgi:hypothetical protein
MRDVECIGNEVYELKCACIIGQPLRNILSSSIKSSHLKAQMIPSWQSSTLLTFLRNTAFPADRCKGSARVQVTSVKHTAIC